MRKPIVIIIAVAAFTGTATAAAPNYLMFPTKAALTKAEVAGRGLHRVWFGVRLEPGQCAPKGRTANLAGDIGYLRIECSWRGGWREITYINTVTGKPWIRLCNPAGDCEIFKR